MGQRDGQSVDLNIPLWFTGLYKGRRQREDTEGNSKLGQADRPAARTGAKNDARGRRVSQRKVCEGSKRGQRRIRKESRLSVP